VEGFRARVTGGVKKRGGKSKVVWFWEKGSEKITGGGNCELVWVTKRGGLWGGEEKVLGLQGLGWDEEGERALDMGNWEDCLEERFKLVREGGCLPGRKK